VDVVTAWLDDRLKEFTLMRATGGKGGTGGV